MASHVAILVLINCAQCGLSFGHGPFAAWTPNPPDRTGEWPVCCFCQITNNLRIALRQLEPSSQDTSGSFFLSRSQDTSGILDTSGSFFFIAIPGYEREFQDCRLDIEERLRRDIETETDVESNGKNRGPICFLPCMYTYVSITRVVVCVFLYNCCWSFAANVSLICLFNHSVFPV